MLVINRYVIVILLDNGCKLTVTLPDWMYILRETERKIYMCDKSVDSTF